MHSSVDLQRMRFGRGGLRTSRADNNQHFVYDQRNSKGRGPHLTARDFDLGEGFQRSGTSYPKLTLNDVSTENRFNIVTNVPPQPTPLLTDAPPLIEDT